MNQYASFYIEANVVCVIILLILVVRTVKSVDKQLRQREFLKSVVTYIFLFLYDIVWMLCFSGIIKSTPLANYIIYFLLFTGISFASFQWYIYSEIIQGNVKLLNFEHRFRWGIPIMIMIGVFFTYIIYIIVSKDYSSLNKYKYFLHNIMMFSAFIYESFASIRSFIRAFKKKNKLNRSLFFRMGFYPLILIFAIYFQLVFTTIPILCFVASLLMLSFYFTGTDQLISIDSLTKLNNRNQLNKYFLQLPKNEDLKNYLLMIDIDGFKGINDTYGHLEGDNALKLVANTFIEVCNNYKYKYFIARYGGDEFVIIASGTSRKDVEELKNNLEKKVILNALKVSLPYKLTISVGIAKIKDKYETLEESFEKADKELYNEKEEKYNPKFY